MRDFDMYSKIQMNNPDICSNSILSCKHYSISILIWTQILGDPKFWKNFKTLIKWTLGRRE